jgi:hypothetical protein
MEEDEKSQGYDVGEEENDVVYMDDEVMDQIDQEQGVLDENDVIEEEDEPEKYIPNDACVGFD